MLSLTGPCTLFYCILDLSCGECDVILYVLCVALLMDLFGLCVGCLTVFVNCLVKQFATCFTFLHDDTRTPREHIPTTIIHRYYYYKSYRLTLIEKKSINRKHIQRDSKGTREEHFRNLKNNQREDT